MIRVFIADDHPVMRQGVRRVIDEAGDMTVVGEAADGRQVLVATETLGWDVLVLDLSLPRIDGSEVLRRVLEARPGARVLVFTIYPEDQHAVQMLRMGAAGYLSKDRPPEELLAAIRTVHAGRAYLTDAVSEQMIAGRAAAVGHESLSAREYQVFRLIVESRSVSEIAAELDLNVSTVSNHIRRIKEKLAVRTTTEIVAYAHRNGLAR